MVKPKKDNEVINVFKEGVEKKLKKDKKLADTLIRRLSELIVDYKEGDFSDKTFEICIGVRHKGEKQFYVTFGDLEIAFKKKEILDHIKD